MGSEECRHWCHQCNEPVWPQGSDSVCPYCNGGFVQELSSHFADHHSTNPPLIPPWLSNHTDTVRSVYNTIFPPIAADDHRYDPTIRPRNHHPMSAGFRHPPADYRIHRDHDHDHHHHHNNFNHEGDDDVDGEDEVIEVIAQLSIDEEEHRGPPPASERAIRALPTVQISARHLNGEGKCSVCQEKFQLRAGARQMPCDHIFHPDCIVPWLERHNTCPVCRFQLPTGSPSRSRRNHSRSRNPFSCLLPRLRQ